MKSQLHDSAELLHWTQPDEQLEQWQAGLYNATISLHLPIKIP